MNYFHLFLAIVAGYLFGSIPFALVVGKLFYKTDIREYGSGNLGGTNTLRVLGKTAGITVTILDVLKGFIAMLVFSILQSDSTITLVAGFAASIGHAFPIFAQFKGGKAVSTYFGFLLGIAVFIQKSPWLFLLAVVIFFSLAFMTRYVSLSSMVASSIASIVSFVMMSNRLASSMLVVIALFIIYRHRENIKRLLAGTENKVSAAKKAPQSDTSKLKN